MSQAPKPRQLNKGAPVFAFDIIPQPGDTYSACPDCLPWQIEVVVDPEGEPGDILLRFWHAADCPALDDEDPQSAAEATGPPDGTEPPGKGHR